MTWPSFFAASISLGVTGSGGGASAMTRVENAAPESNAPDPLSTSRREIFGFFIWCHSRSGEIAMPEVIFYSSSPHPVFRRPLLAIAARLDSEIWQAPCPAQNKIRIRELEMTGPRLAL